MRDPEHLSHPVLARLRFLLGATNPLSGSGSSERWESASAAGTASAGGSATVAYVHQYTLSVTGGNGISYSIPSETGDNFWNAGDSLTVSSNGVWGRGGGTGQRVASWNVDGGPNNLVATTGKVTTSSITMSAPHTVSFNAVTQYQLTRGCRRNRRAVVGDTFPAVSGDDYWYDSGTSVTYTGNGVFGRGSGTGSRATDWSIDSGASNPVLTAGTFPTSSIDMSGAHTVHVTTITQYLLALSAYPSSAGTTAYNTMPSIPGDAGWYDSGTNASFSVTPNSGFSFDVWVGAGACSYSGPQESASVQMTCAASEAASFVSSVSHNSYVSQAIVLQAAAPGGLAPEFSITGCDAAPTSILGDSVPHSVELLPVVQIYHLDIQRRECQVRLLRFGGVLGYLAHRAELFMGHLQRHDPHLL